MMQKITLAMALAVWLGACAQSRFIVDRDAACSAYRNDSGANPDGSDYFNSLG